VQVEVSWGATRIELDHVNVELRSIDRREQRPLPPSISAQGFGLPVPASDQLD
jgi:hypothetical protein